MSTTAPMTPPRARLELALWQADAHSVSNADIYARLTDMGLPPEVAIRLKALREVLKPIGGKLVSIGKIIVLKLIDFIDQHPNLATGIALGAALSSLIVSIPFFGPMLAPVALSLGIAVGAIAGHRADKAQGGKINVIRNGAMSEGRRRELLQFYRERLMAIEQRERSQQISSPDRNQFIASLREVVEKDLRPAPKAFQLIDAVERGAMPLSQAYALVIDLLESGR